MDLRRCLDQVLQVSPVHAVSTQSAEISTNKNDVPREEVSQMHEFTMTLVLDVDNAPTVLAAADRLAINNHIAFRADDRERDDVLGGWEYDQCWKERGPTGIRTLIDSLSCNSSSSFSSVSKGYRRILWYTNSSRICSHSEMRTKEAEW